MVHKSIHSPSFSPILFALLQLLIIFACILYTYVRIHPIFLYQEAEPVFLKTWGFFVPFLQRSGGIAEYIQMFILTCCQSNVLGAFMLGSSAFAIGWLVRRIAVHTAPGNTPHNGQAKGVANATEASPASREVQQYRLWIQCLATAIMVMLINESSSDAVRIVFDLLWALVWVVLFIRLATVFSFQVAIAIAFDLIVLWVAGGNASMVFMLGIVSCKAAHRKWGQSGVLLAVCLSLMGGMCLITGINPSQTLTAWGVGFPLGFALVFAAFLCAVILLVRGVTQRLDRSPSQTSGKHSHATSTKDKILMGISPNWTVGILLCAAAIIVLGFRSDEEKRRFQAVKLHAAKEQWTRLLDRSRDPSLYSRIVDDVPLRVEIVRGLYQTDKLCDELFSYPQIKTDEFVPGMDYGVEICMNVAATMFEAGQINVAEHFAHEVLELKGEIPEPLLLLAKINILKDRSRAAKVFLNVLRQCLFQEKTADAYLKALNADPRMHDDPEISRIRPLLVATDYPSSFTPTATLMKQLLHTNKKNRMAFEYLMMHYLVSVQLEKFAENLERIKELSYPVIPKHIEEAILLSEQFKFIPPNEIAKYPIRKETREQFERFQARVKEGKLEAIHTELSRDFGKTYWFFFLYQYSPGRDKPPHRLSKS